MLAHTKGAQMVYWPRILAVMSLRGTSLSYMVMGKIKKYFDFAPSLIINFLEHIQVLVQAVLSLAAGRTRSCPRSLSLTLLKLFFQNVKLDLFRHKLMVRRGMKKI